MQQYPEDIAVNNLPNMNYKGEAPLYFRHFSY